MNQAQTASAVQRMQAYIDAHINEPITLKQLACAAGYSPWHAAKLFHEITGKPPFDYIRALRLTRAALALRDGKPRIIDVALDFVFDSHEGFTRAFTKEFGLPPKRYSLNTPPIQLFLPEKAFDAYRALNKRGVTVMSETKTVKTLFVQVIERPARKLMLKRGIAATDYFAYCEEVGCDVWALLSSVKEALYEPVGLWLPKHLIKPGTSEYVQGVELPLSYANAVPEGYDLIELPPASMMVFQGEPYDDEDFMEAIGEVWETIEKYNPETYGFAWAPEAAPRFQLVPLGYRGYIEARPVAALPGRGI
jgi:AraC-like DNA-binding protein